MDEIDPEDEDGLDDLCDRVSRIKPSISYRPDILHDVINTIKPQTDAMEAVFRILATVFSYADSGYLDDGIFLSFSGDPRHKGEYLILYLTQSSFAPAGRSLLPKPGHSERFGYYLRDHYVIGPGYIPEAFYLGKQQYEKDMTEFLDYIVDVYDEGIRYSY